MWQSLLEDHKKKRTTDGSQIKNKEKKPKGKQNKTTTKKPVPQVKTLQMYREVSKESDSVQASEPTKRTGIWISKTYLQICNLNFSEASKDFQI